MGDCNHDCEHCGSKCSDEKKPESFLEPQNALSDIKKVIGVVSGKGGVGKSLVTSMLAVEMRRRGYEVGVLDADVTGPSIPKAFGIHEHATSDNQGLYPVLTKTGIEIMSTNLLLENESDPVVWRGPVIAGAVKQFWTDVIWEDIDWMFVDMPPGTGDVPLTVFQSLPVDGIVIVASPQDLVSMIVEKAVKMAGLMNIPVLAIVENMSYFVCPNCNEKHYIFGESNIDALAKQYNIDIVAKLPIDNKIAACVDKGTVELIDTSFIKNIGDMLENLK